MMRLPSADVALASWDQIAELRKDAEAAGKLRRLRLFFFENYQHKPVSFIKDDLLLRLHDYEAARKKHGFEVMTSALSSLLSAENLKTAIGTGIAATIFGGTTVGLGASAVVEFGNFALELSKKLYEVLDFVQNHEFVYLIEVQKKLK